MYVLILVLQFQYAVPVSPDRTGQPKPILTAGRTIHRINKPVPTYNLLRIIYHLKMTK